MRILMLVGWKVRKCNNIPSDLQPPDYYCKGKPYWFFRHLQRENIDVDVVDINYNWRLWEQFEKKILHFYIGQFLKNILNLRNYDLILSHGAQSGVFLSFVRSLIGTKHPPHIIIDIGALNGGREKTNELALFRFAMRSVAGLIYHVRQQELHYQRYFPELSIRTRFVAFGPDIDLFAPMPEVSTEDYILSVGYAKRDWTTLISAFAGLSNPKPELRILGDPKPISGVLPQDVSATGKVSFREMMRQIAAARFIVVPLPYIPYAVGQMTVLQSMAMGKAVIVSRVPSMFDYITEGKDGLFYSPSNVNELQKKIQYLVERQDIIKSLEINARLSTESRFNERLMAKGIWDAILDLVT